MSSYNKRVWLNPNDNSSTGAIVCFSGYSQWEDRDGNREISHFVEVSDCHCKARIHRGKYDTLEDYLNKLRLLRDSIDEYVGYLESVDEQDISG